MTTSSRNRSKRRLPFPFRYVTVMLTASALATLYGFKMNVSYGLIGMVNFTAIQSKVTNHVSHNGTSACANLKEIGTNESGATPLPDGPFVWDQTIQDLILSSYFWGFVSCQIIGGRIAELFSAKWVLMGCILINVIGSILLPLAAGVHYSLFIVLRVLQGIGGSAGYPATHVLISKWAPLNERSMFSAISYAGSSFGVMIAAGLSGVLIEQVGWAGTFYIEGLVPLIWCVASWILLHDSPREQTVGITRMERAYIESSLGKTEQSASDKKYPVPWSRVFRSVPFLAILISHCCSNFGWILLTTQMPAFMVRTLKFTPSKSAGLLSIAYLAKVVVAIVIAKILGILTTRGVISLVASRKIAMIIATAGPLIGLLGISFVGCDRAWVVGLLIFIIGCKGGTFSGFMVSHIDIAPNFAGTLMGITHTMSSSSGLIIPLVVGALTQGQQTMEAWRKVFYLTAGIYAIDIFTFVTFASTEVQPWNDVEEYQEVQLEEPIYEKREHCTEKLRKDSR